MEAAETSSGVAEARTKRTERRPEAFRVMIAAGFLPPFKWRWNVFIVGVFNLQTNILALSFGITQNIVVKNRGLNVSPINE
jgi:hypothetical protein